MLYFICTHAIVQYIYMLYIIFMYEQICMRNLQMMETCYILMQLAYLFTISRKKMPSSAFSSAVYELLHLSLILNHLNEPVL